MTSKADSPAVADYKQRIIAKAKALTVEQVEQASYEEISEMVGVMREEVYEADRQAFAVFTKKLIDGKAAEKDPTKLH